MTKHSLAALAAAACLASCGPSGNHAAAPATKDSAAPLAIDKTGTAEGVDFTVTKVATTDQIGPGGMGLKAQPGETFVVMSYTVKNTGSKPLPIMERPGLSLVDPAGQTYTQDDIASGMAAMGMADASGQSSDLNPGVSARAKAAWKLQRKGFDRATWRLVAGTEPRLTFALK